MGGRQHPCSTMVCQERDLEFISGLCFQRFSSLIAKTKMLSTISRYVVLLWP